MAFGCLHCAVRGVESCPRHNLETWIAKENKRLRQARRDREKRRRG